MNLVCQFKELRCSKFADYETVFLVIQYHQNVRQRIWEMSHLSRTHRTILNTKLAELTLGSDLTLIFASLLFLFSQNKYFLIRAVIKGCEYLKLVGL